MMNSQNLSKFRIEMVIMFFIFLELVCCCPFNDYEDSLLSEYYPIQETIIEQMSPSQTFAFWSFSIPLWKVKTYPQVEDPPTSETRTYQLMFLLKSMDDERVVMFMYAVIDENSDKVVHKLRVEELDSWGWPTFGSYSFEYDPLNYEGTWMLTMITIQQKQVIFQTSNYVTNNNIGDILEELNKVKVIIGGTGYIDVFTVGMFRGRLSKLMQFVDYSEQKFEEVENDCKVPEKVIGEQIIELFPDVYTFKGDSQNIFDIDQVGKRFCLSGWVKYDPTDAVKSINYLLVRITTNKNYGNNMYIGDEILKIIATLNRIDKKETSYLIESNHYAIPIRQQNVFPNIRQYAWLFLDEYPFLYIDALTSWHYIQFEYGRTTGPKTVLKIKYFAGNLDKEEDAFSDDTRAGHFINTKYYLIFGSDTVNPRQLKGQVSKFKFSYNYESDKDFIYECDYSCQTCNGPQNNNCLTCSQDQIRVLIEDKNVCRCNEGYLEKEKICYSFDEIYPTLVYRDIIQDTQDLECSFGYFQLPSTKTCIKCPQQSTSELLCVDCLFNSMTWHEKPLCTTDYITQQRQINEDAYRKHQRSNIDYDLYIINEDNNLQLIQGASDFCNPEDDLSNCYQIPFQKHLSKNVYVICKENHYFLNNQCTLSSSSCLKSNQQQSTCLECKEGYYLSRDQYCELCPNQCLTCKAVNNIPQCLSCPSRYEPVAEKCLKCGLNCSICRYQKNYLINEFYLRCLKCVDQQKYYLSLNGVDCLENTIENCEIAYETNTGDGIKYNSFDYDFVPYVGEVISKCAKCVQPYCYNESTLTCEISGYVECPYCISTPDNYIQNVCLYGEREFRFDVSDTSELGSISFTEGCQGYNNNCFLCVLGQANGAFSYQCLVCQEGYFAHKLTAQCEPCPPNLLCSSCYQQDKKAKDNWKNDIRSYYKVQIDDIFQSHSFIEYGTSPNGEDYEVVCSNCQSGYELYNDQCIEKCPDDCLECLLIDNKNVCIKCPNTIKGRSLSVDNNHCITCPINCSLCRQRDQDEIRSINPIFNSQEFAYSSNQCLKGYTGIFDQYLGNYVDCPSTLCQKKLEINLNLYCDIDKYNRELMDIVQEEQQIQFKQSNILITDLFSTSSFKEFETQQFYLLANQKIIQTISIKIVSSQNQVCIINGNKGIQQKFSENIFSAINVELLIQGNGFTTFSYDRSISIINFKHVKLAGIKLNPIQVGNIKQLVFHSAFLQTIQLFQVKYDCSIQQDKSQIIINNADNVIIDQFESSNLNLINIDSFIKIQAIDYAQLIQISNLNIVNSELQNIILFFFLTNNNAEVELKKFQITSKFTSAQLLNLQYGQLKMEDISILNSELNDVDNLFHLESLLTININSLYISQSIIKKSTIFNLNQNSRIINLRFHQNQLLSNSILIINQKINVEQYTFDQIFFELNQYDEDSKFIIIKQNLSPNKQIIFIDLQLIGNNLKSLSSIEQLEQQAISLIYLSLQSVQITSLKIERGSGIKEFSFVDLDSLKINDLIITQHSASKFLGLHKFVDCLQKNLGYYVTSLYMYDIKEIEINQLTIQNAESLDYSIINIQTSISKISSQNSIKLSNLNVRNNLLLIANQMKQASIIYISTQLEFQIDITNSIFQKNILHQYQQNDLVNQGLLLNFDCSYCTVNMDNLLAESNIVTNSSDSIIHIKSKKLIIKNANFTLNCIFDYNVLQPYLFWGFRKNEEVFLEQIMSIFPIYVLSGNARLISEDLEINNILITNSSGSGLYIRMQNDARIVISNSVFSFISNHFLSENENGGAIYIDFTNSISSAITVKNITANNIYCRNKGGLIYLINGDGSMQLSLINIYLNDVFAFIGSLIYTEFSVLTTQQQNFRLNGSKVSNTVNGQLTFFGKFSMLSDSQIQALMYQRFQIMISNANTIQLENIVISDINLESFLSLYNTKNIQIQSIRISRSNYLQKVITLSNMQQNSKIFINKIQFENLIQLNQIGMESNCSKTLQQFDSQYICLSEIQKSPIQLSLKYADPSKQNQQCVINQMNQLYQQQKQSIIDIQPSYTNMSISQVTLQSINCTTCLNGLINVNFIDFNSFLFIQSLKLKHNICSKSSCVKIERTQTQQRRLLQNIISQVYDKQFDLRINDYYCKYNEAYEGTCLSIKNIKTLILKSVFEQNIATSSGGSIAVYGNEIFYLVQSIIYNNSAKYGGGLEIKDQMNQNLTNFGSFISNNKADLFGNDSSQVPSQLSITINLKDILPKIKVLEREDLLIDQILIKPYQAFKNQFTDAFYVPNGQKISEYQYFDWNKGEYVPYNLHFRIVALDKLNSIQQNLDNTYCDISGRLLKDEGENEFTQNFTNLKRIEFNKTDYNLDNLIVYLDDQLNKTLQLQISCNSIFIPIQNELKEIVSYHNNYYLRINLKTLPCQMGEIKSQSDSTCVPCDVEQGQYSLDVNSNTCLYMNDATTSEIKSAQLKLKAGYWRPYLDTDQISECINLMDNCLGGWKEGDNSCYKGHIGALCEECDLYDLRGEGHYSTSTKYSCGSCTEKDKNSVIITAITIWTLVSILISVKSSVELLTIAAIKVRISKIKAFSFIQEDQSGVLIKMLTNHLQILSAITTFQLNMPNGVNDAIKASGNPMQTMAFSLDCFLIDMFDFSIHYSRMVWQIIMPFIYIFVFLGMYFIIIKIKKGAYHLSVVTTTFIYMYIYLQPNLVGGLISLISFRTISGFKWISANVAYRYDTWNHLKWLLGFCLPSVLVIAFIIPAIFYFAIYLNRHRLDDKKIRQQWGYLYHEYSTNVYFWEIVKILEKELLIIFLSYYDEKIVKKGILVLFVVYLYQELNLKFKPYSSPNLNRLDAYSANVCAISIALGIGIYIDQQIGSLEVQIPYFIIIASLNIYYLLLVLKELLKAYGKELEIQLDKARDMVRLKFPQAIKYPFLNKILKNRQQQRTEVIKNFKKIKEYLIKQAKHILHFKEALKHQMESGAVSLQNLDNQYVNGFLQYKTANSLQNLKDEKLLNGDNPGSNGQEYRLTRVYPLIINES